MDHKTRCATALHLFLLRHDAKEIGRTSNSMEDKIDSFYYIYGDGVLLIHEGDNEIGSFNLKGDQLVQRGQICT